MDGILPCEHPISWGLNHWTLEPMERGMCTVCSETSDRNGARHGDSIHRSGIARRSFLTTVGAGALAVTANSQLGVAASPVSPEPVNPNDAIKRLAAGNQRFVRGKVRRVVPTHEMLAELEKGQHPFATILGCSDSRVPIEFIFDQGLGDLFVIRLAGNVVDFDVEGSLEYAVEHLHTKLVVVLGHEGCGAVTAALSAQKEQQKELPGIRYLLQNILPAIQGIDPKLPPEQRLKKAVEANVRQSVREILSFPGHSEMYKDGLFKAVGAVYEMHTGRVRFLDDE